MPLKPATNREHDLWAKQHLPRRSQESADRISYIVVWKLYNPQRRPDGRLQINKFSTRESKPIALLSEATEIYERRKAYAIFVELLQYSDNAITFVRRFCNLGRYRQLTSNVAWVLAVDNPPYEIRDVAEEKAVRGE